MSRTIVSLGGSVVIPRTGFDVKFLKAFRRLILGRVKKGDKFILVVGGGATCRIYQSALSQVVRLPNRQSHLLGMYSTWFNAEFVRLLFGEHAHAEVVKNPDLKIATSKPIIVAGGGKPGFSTDTTSVIWAEKFGAKELFNLSNIDYVYDKDPNKFSTAKKIIEISWPDFRRRIVGYKWLPGKNAPFDPIASGIAQRLGLKVYVLNGRSLGEVEKALEGRKFKGTTIGP